MSRVFCALALPSFASFFRRIWFALVNAVSDIEKKLEQTISRAMARMYIRVSTIAYSLTLTRNCRLDIIRPFAGASGCMNLTLSCSRESGTACPDGPVPQPENSQTMHPWRGAMDAPLFLIYYIIIKD